MPMGTATSAWLPSWCARASSSGAWRVSEKVLVANCGSRPEPDAGRDRAILVGAYRTAPTMFSTVTTAFGAATRGANGKGPVAQVAKRRLDVLVPRLRRFNSGMGRS